MSQRQYALRRKQLGLPGGSHVAVGNAVRAGRLARSVNAEGKIVDPELADREWAENTDHSEAPSSVLEKTAARGRPPKARAREAPPPGEGAQASGESPPSDGRPQPVVGGGLTENNAVKAYWQALHEELDYRKAAGKLVPAADVDAKVRGVFTVTRVKLLTLPSRAKTLLGLSAAQVLQLETLTRELLEELAAGRAT